MVGYALRRWFLAVTLTAGLGVLATPAAARPPTVGAAALPTLYTALRPHILAVKPASVIIAQDGASVLGGFDGTGRANFGHMKWSRWNQGEGIGSGAFWIDDCLPSCATGTFSPFAVTAKAFAPKGGHFTRLTLKYTYLGKDDTSRLGIQRSGSGYFYYPIGFTSVPHPSSPSPQPTGPCMEKVPVFNKVVAVGTCIQSIGSGRYQSVGQLRVNGLDFVPAGNGVVTLDVPGKLVTASAPGAIKIGPLPISLWAHSLHFDLSGQLKFTPLGALKVFGFPLADKLDGTWDPSTDGVTLHGNVSLSVLGDTVIADITLAADNEKSLHLDGLDITLKKPDASPDPNHHAGETCDPNNPPWPAGFDCAGTSTAGSPFTWQLEPLDNSLVKLGGKLPISDLELKYKAADSSWEGKATLDLSSLLPTSGFRSHFPTVELGAGITTNPFAFNQASGEVSNMNLPLPGGVFLQKIGVDLHLRPELEVKGDAAISAGPEIDGKTALTMDAGFDYKKGETQGFSLNLNGDLKLADEVQLGEAHVTYDNTSGGTMVSFGGKLGGSFGPIDLQLDAAGAVNAQHIQAMGNATMTAFGQGISGHGVISDAGFGACGNLDVLFFHGEVGFKHLFSTGETDFNGCDFGGLYTIDTAGARAAAAGTSTAVPAGRSQVEFAAVGATAPPDAVLTGPGGQRLETPTTPDRIVVSQQGLAIADTGSHTTYFIVQHPAAGTWTIAAGAAGPPPARYERADPWQSPTIHARVSGRGRRRRLNWKLHSQLGQSVIFMEEGASVNRTLTGAVTRAGHVSFQPAPGPAGTRHVVALVEKDGLLRDRLTVASFHASATRLPRPGSASYRFGKGRLTVTWRSVRGVSAYEVDVGVGKGQVVRVRSSAGSRKVVLPMGAGVTPRRIVVAGIFGGQPGPAATARRR